MKSMLIFFAAVLGMSPAFAECVYPKTPPSAPNGNTATQEEMVAGMQAVRQYNETMTVYLKCLDDEATARIQEAGADQDKVKRIKSMATEKHDAAIDELNSRADDFNAQLKIFKQKQKS